MECKAKHSGLKLGKEQTKLNLHLLFHFLHYKDKAADWAIGVQFPAWQNLSRRR
jgi:hypothetical protein